MKKLAHTLNFISSICNKISMFLVGLFMLVMVIDVLFGVTNRFILKWSVSWTEELSRYLMIWICMLGAAVAVFFSEHIGISLVLDRLKKSKKVVVFINHLFSMSFLLVIAVYGAILCKSQISQTSPALGVSMIWPFLSIPTGASIMILHIFSKIISSDR